MNKTFDKPHGGRVTEAAKLLGVKPEEIIDFSANINPQGLPPGLKTLLISSINSIIHYPEIKAKTLIEKLAQKAELPTWSILAEAGSTPLIYMLARHLGTKRHCVIAPAFSEYEAALEIAGLRMIHYHVLKESNGFLMTESDVEAILSEKHDLIILANPANPTGRLVPPKCLQRLIEASTREGFWLVVDEAFMGFCEKPNSVESLIVQHTSLIVLKSLTKLFAIPGLRLGYMACGNRFFMSNLSDCLEPWCINSLAQRAGVFLLDKTQYVNKTPAVTSELRLSLIAELDPFFDFIESDCNFVMAKFKSEKTQVNRLKDAAALKQQKEKILEYLFANGILIRDLDGMIGLEDGFVRLAVRPRQEVSWLKKTLLAYHSKAKRP
jgi:threonine-phosphate decarboxylase